MSRGVSVKLGFHSNETPVHHSHMWLYPNTLHHLSEIKNAIKCVIQGNDILNTMSSITVRVEIVHNYKRFNLEFKVGLDVTEKNSWIHEVRLLSAELQDITVRASLTYRCDVEIDGAYPDVDLLGVNLSQLAQGKIMTTLEGDVLMIE